MLTIYTKTFMTATRMGEPLGQRKPHAGESRRKHWQMPPHWVTGFRDF